MKKISTSILMLIGVVSLATAQQKTVIIKSDVPVGGKKEVKIIRIEKNNDAPAPEKMIVQMDSVAGENKQVKIIRIEKNAVSEEAPKSMILKIDTTISSDGKSQQVQVEVIKSSKGKERKGKRRNQINENTVMIYSDSKINIDSMIKMDTTQISVGNKKIVIIGEPNIQKIWIEKDTLGDFFDKSEFKAELKSELKDLDKEFRGLDNDRNKGSRADRKKSKKANNDFSGLEFSLGYNGWLEDGSTALSLSNNNLELINSKSTHVNLVYVNYFKLYKNNIHFSAGLGLDWNNYRFAKNVTLTPRVDSMQTTIDNINYSKNKLMAKYVTVPLQLHFATKPLRNGERLAIAGGVELGYLLNGRQKQISEERGKQKIDDDYNLADIRLGYMLRASYGSTGIYAKVYPNSAFKPSQGPDLNTFCIGLTFGLD
ncbi:MAG: hypothetical protein RI934_797 [Bacteroidota bacterium]|jgi:hypothetical protein